MLEICDLLNCKKLQIIFFRQNAFCTVFQRHTDFSFSAELLIWVVANMDASIRRILLIWDEVKSSWTSAASIFFQFYKFHFNFQLNRKTRLAAPRRVQCRCSDNRRLLKTKHVRYRSLTSARDECHLPVQEQPFPIPGHAPHSSKPSIGLSRYNFR